MEGACAGLRSGPAAQAPRFLQRVRAMTQGSLQVRSNVRVRPEKSSVNVSGSSEKRQALGASFRHGRGGVLWLCPEAPRHVTTLPRWEAGTGILLTRLQ